MITDALEPLETKKCQSDAEKHLRSLTKTFTGIEKPLKNYQDVQSLQHLIDELYKVFDSDSVNIEYVNHLMISYSSNPSEWKRFAKFDRFRYTRNLVDAGNGKFNLIILCWGEGHGSGIHDHADSHCFMKMLKGTLRETQYSWPNESARALNASSADEEDESNYDKEILQEIGRRDLNYNECCYINDTIGLHRVENPSHADTAVSLHLYCPPFNSCKVFNKATGKSTKSQVTFWSKYGERLNKE